jgi:hypothetical protein
MRARTHTHTHTDTHTHENLLKSVAVVESQKVAFIDQLLLALDLCGLVSRRSRGSGVADTIDFISTREPLAVMRVIGLRATNVRTDFPLRHHGVAKLGSPSLVQKLIGFL